MKAAIAVRIYDTWYETRARLQPAIIYDDKVVVLNKPSFTRRYVQRSLIEKILEKAKSVKVVEKRVEYYVIELDEFRKLAEKIAKEQGYAAQNLRNNIPRGLLDIADEFARIISEHTSK